MDHTFLVHNPSVKKEEIPSELVTASSSGSYPDVSPEGAYVKVARITKARHITTEKIKKFSYPIDSKALFKAIWSKKLIY